MFVQAFTSGKTSVGLVLFVFMLGTYLHITRASSNYFISAPDVFHLGQKEKVSIVIMDTPGSAKVTINLHLTGESRRFSQKSVDVTPGTPITVDMMVKSDDLEDTILNIQYVNLVVECNAQHLAFHESTKILVSKRSHFVLIQLDKPVYTPRQEVMFRVFTMNLDLKPEKIPLEVVIINPQSVILETYDPSDVSTFSGTYDDYGILTARYPFSDFPVLGKWKVKVKYGHKMKQVSEEVFELNEYTLPTFSVAIECPEVITPDDYLNGIDVYITAGYLFGESQPSDSADSSKGNIDFRAVNGTAVVRIGLLDDEDVITYFSRNTLSELNMTASNRPHRSPPRTKIPVDLSFLSTENTFDDDLLGQRLYIEATVTDIISGIRNTEISTKTTISTKKYVIDLSQTQKYFTPGLFTLRIKTLYANGAIKGGANLNVMGKARNLSSQTLFPLIREGQLKNPTRISTDDHGKANYIFKIPHDAVEIELKVQERSPKVTTGRFGVNIDEQTVSATMTATKYHSNTNSFLHIHQAEAKELLTAYIHITVGEGLPAPSKLYFMVLGRGMIIKQGVRIIDSQPRSLVVHLSTRMHDDMFPEARLLVYFVQVDTKGRYEIVADALWFEVTKRSRECNAVLYTDRRQYRPSQQINLKFEGSPHSMMALLAVDRGVYQINKHKSLPTQKVLAQSLDTACSPGGGSDNKNVFQGAGLTAINNLGMSMTERKYEKCKQPFRRNKRDTDEPETKVLSLEECCSKGVEKALETRNKSACISLAIRQSGQSAECRNKMLLCCIGHLKKLNTPTTTTEAEVIGFGGGGYGDYYRYYNGHEDNVVQEIDLGKGVISGTGTFELPDEDWSSEEIKFADYNGIPARRRFPEAFLFETHSSGRTGIAEMTVKLPDSITTWVFQGVTVHKEKGICVAQSKHVTSFKGIFVKANMPATAVKGEQIIIRATFYNYHNYLGGIPARAYLYVADGICAKAPPRQRSDRVSLGKIKKGHAKTHSWPIIPLKPGSLNITVIMTTPEGADKVEKWLVVKPSGEIGRTSISIPLNPAGICNDPLTSYIDNEYQANPPKQKVTINMKALSGNLTEKLVAGTTECSVKLQGHILAPIVDKFLNDDGLNSKWGIPTKTACGEQTLYKLAPTIMAALYLKHTNKLTTAREERAKDYIKGSLERELRFRQGDGSFSFWPSKDVGQTDKGKSTWLTAFVVKLMSYAAAEFDVMLNYEGQSVNQKGVICDAMNWLLSQQKEDGHFHEPYADRSHKLHLVGGVQNTKSLTAFVLVALLQAADTVKKHCAKDITSELIKGFEYLKEYVHTLEQNTTDSMTVAILTYALARFNSELMYDANRSLRNRMIFDEERNTLFLPEYNLDNYKGFVKQWSDSIQLSWTNPKSALTIEQTAYALLAQVYLKEYAKAYPIVSWLLSQRNSFGAFRSTQDTVVGLEALTAYKLGSDEVRTNLQCDIKLQDQRDHIKSYTLNGEVDDLKKERVLKQEEIGHENLTIEVTGEGFAQAYVNLQYYYKPTSTQQADGCPYFSLVVSEEEGQSRGVHKITVCTRNKQRSTTAMGIIDIGIVTGQKVKKQSLEKLKDEHTVSTYEISDSSVTLYLEMIPKDELCVTIDTKENGDVEKTHPAVVSVFDYYEPDRKCNRIYGGKQGPNQNILRHSCNTMGKCQCDEY